MNRQINLTDLVNELRTQNAKKLDLVIPSSHIVMVDGKLEIINGDEPTDEISKILRESGIQAQNGNLILDPLETAHSHLSEKLGVPKKYYDTLCQPSNLNCLDYNVNHWLKKESKNFFIRSFVDKQEKTGVCRAILSDRFKVIDNFDVLLAALQAIKESGMNLTVENADITDKKMYVRFINPDIEIQSPKLLKSYFNGGGGNADNMKNTGIVSGFILSNSEVGQGQFSITPRIVILACRNGMIFKNEMYGKTHLGAKMDEFSKIDWSEETKRINHELIISQTKDAISTYISEDYFSGKIQELEQRGEKELTHPIETVKNVTKTLQISEKEQTDILNYFVKEKDFTAFGVSQALTYHAHENADADLQTELETVAVDILSDMDKYDVPEKKKSVATQSKNN